MQQYIKEIFLVLVWYMSSAYGGPQRCLFLLDRCVESCPHNMHPYHTRCDVDTISQKTCATPEIYVIGFSCGWSRCDCNGDLVLSEYEGCMPVTDCAGSRSRPPGKKLRRRRKGKRYGRLRADDDVDEMRKGLDPVHHMGDYPTNVIYEPPEETAQ